MTNKPKIEFLCSGNSGRSPLAQGFCTKYLRDLGEDRYEVISSGTRVNELAEYRTRKKYLPNEEVVWALKKGLERHLFGDGNAARRLSVAEVIDATESDTMQSYAHQALSTFEQDEKAYRKEAFKQFGLGVPKLTHDQTIIVPGVVLVLGMENKHVDFAKGLYSSSGFYPTLDLLERYASMPLTEFKGAFGGTLQDYLSMAERIRVCVNKSMDRLLKK